MVITTCSCHHAKSDLRSSPLTDNRGPTSTERSPLHKRKMAEYSPTGSIKTPSSGDRYTTPEYNAV